jgi:Skp family chaperone for outer membrane proteins
MSVVKKQLVSLILGIAMIGAFSVPAAAQELRVGVVNIQALMEQAPQTKAAMDASSKKSLRTCRPKRKKISP